MQVMCSLRDSTIINPRDISSMGLGVREIMFRDGKFRDIPSPHPVNWTPGQHFFVHQTDGSALIDACTNLRVKTLDLHSKRVYGSTMLWAVGESSRSRYQKQEEVKWVNLRPETGMAAAARCIMPVHLAGNSCRVAGSSQAFTATSTKNQGNSWPLNANHKKDGSVQAFKAF